jgi:hypothetical protein
MSDQKKPEVTDLVPEPDKDKETNTAKATTDGKSLKDVAAKFKGKSSLAKFGGFTNGKLRD